MTRRHFLAIAAASAATAADLQDLVRKAKSGETVVLPDGTYTDIDLVVEGEGITVRAQTPGRVILTGKSRLRVAGRHVTVDGLFFKDGTDMDEVIAFRAS